MQPLVILRILGLLLMFFSLSQLPPLLVGVLAKETDLTPFIEAFFALLIAGALIWVPFRKQRGELKLRDGFLVVILFWVVLGVSGSLPFLLQQNGVLQQGGGISVTDAVFESISGLTTTGATVIDNLDTLPKSLLFYRQLLQWLGGMGIIVLAVAVLPILGVGGTQLYRAETPGPVKDNKLTPRIKETAKLLWIIYLSFTVICAVAYFLAGMSWFDAICHSFSTIAIGGFSTHDASLGHFDSSGIYAVATVFMLLSSASFSLHYLIWRKNDIRLYRDDSELRFFVATIVGISCVGLLYSIAAGGWNPDFKRTMEALFQIVSIVSTTGFTNGSVNTSANELAAWEPVFFPMLLIFASFMGGCSGSTAGGMKVVRVLLLFRQGAREVRKLIHPNARITVKLNRKRVPDEIMQAVWGFFSVYVGLFVLFMLLLMANGLDQVSAFSAVAAAINNLGPGLEEVAENYATLGDFDKWVLCLAMLLGRLEIFTLLVVFSPAFWRS